MTSNKPTLSTVFSGLSSRITVMQRDIRMIERERLLLNPQKLVPIHEFISIFTRQGVPDAQITYLNRAVRKTTESALIHCMQQAARRQVGIYFADIEILPAPLAQSASEIFDKP